MASFFTRWYDLLCLAMIATAALGSLWVIGAGELDKLRRRRRKGGGPKCEGLLATAADDDDGEEEEEEEEEEKETVYSRDLWLSRWPAVHPAALLVLRAAAAATMVGVLFWDLRTYDWSIMVYYTEWTFSLVIIYFSIATVISAHGCWIYEKRARENDEVEASLRRNVAEDIPVTLTGSNRNRKTSKLQSCYYQDNHEEKAGFWGYLMQIAYQTSAGAVALTDIVFWGLLVPFLSVQHFKLDLPIGSCTLLLLAAGSHLKLMGCMHTLNFVFLLLDIALNSLPFPWFRMAYFVLWSIIYVIFQWILHACGFSWWPYPFLELSTPWAPLWYLCLAVVHVPCYGLCWLLVDAKISLPQIFFRHAYRRP